MPKMRDPRSLLTVEEVADRLNCSDQWVYLAARRRLIASVHIGKSLRFEESAIEDYIAQNTTEAVHA